MGKKGGGTKLREKIERQDTHGFQSPEPYSEKGVLKDVTREMYDFRPDYVFLTETSATPWGYFLKEIYKKAYPDRELPKFYRINPSVLSELESDKFDRVHENELKKEKRKKLWKFFGKRITKGNSRIVIFDEMCGRHYSTDRVKKFLEEYGVDSSNIEVVLPHVKKKGEIVAGIEMYPHVYLTSKEKPWDYDFSVSKQKGETKFVGEITRNDLKGKLDYIHDAKEIGAEIGDGIRLEDQERSDLERRIGGIISIIGLLGSVFFLSSNITGNVVVNLSLQSVNILGVVLFLLGVVGVFFYFRKK